MQHTQKQKLICWIMFWFCHVTMVLVGHLVRLTMTARMNAMFGIQNNKMKNWETNVNGYTSEDKGVADQIAAYSAK